MPRHADLGWPSDASPLGASLQGARRFWGDGWVCCRVGPLCAWQCFCGDRGDFGELDRAPRGPCNPSAQEPYLTAASHVFATSTGGCCIWEAAAIRPIVAKNRAHAAREIMHLRKLVTVPQQSHAAQNAAVQGRRKICGPALKAPLLLEISRAPGHGFQKARVCGGRRRRCERRRGGPPRSWRTTRPEGTPPPQTGGTPACSPCCACCGAATIRTTCWPSHPAVQTIFSILSTVCQDAYQEWPHTTVCATFGNSASA